MITSHDIDAADQLLMEFTPTLYFYGRDTVIPIYIYMVIFVNVSETMVQCTPFGSSHLNNIMDYTIQTTELSVSNL